MNSSTNHDAFYLDGSSTYDYTSSALTQIDVTDTPGLWTCCKCDGVVDPAIHGTTCTPCGHNKCSDCRGTEHPTPPIKNQFNSYNTTHDHQQSLGSPNIPHEQSRYGESTPTYYTSNPGYDYTRGPNLDGYWTCCQCGCGVASWNGNQCPDCQHTFCSYCINHGSTAIQ
ncbi:hypothetical protein VTL71DRAFT_6622 [Oculimacula yallundae]|uniref:RING-type domain-containing protein n=1 Tax=Oculimacula yallundae TaxID=86028 RepID=A0ABR4BZ12_9HELO